MGRAEIAPSPGALEEARCLAGPSAAIRSVVRLAGGQHAETWKVDTESPARSVVLRQFPPGDAAAERERLVLQALDGLGGLAPVLLGCDLDGRWSRQPTTLISWLAGEADITPSDPQKWARELGRALAVVHAVPSERLSGLPSLFDHSGGNPERLEGPLANAVRSRWAEITAASAVLTHNDFWSGNVVWRDGTLTGIVDWSGASRGPRGYDLGWCRLDLVLLFDEGIAEVMLEAYESAVGRPVGDVDLWDGWAAASSHSGVTSWGPNYAPLGRPDLDADELRSRHASWTARLLEK